MEKQETAKSISLSNAQKKFLRRIGHELSPLVYIGREGLGETVLAEIDTALRTRELIKVKIVNTSELSKHEAAEQIPRLTASELVQLIGKTLLLYRQNPKRKKDERINLPPA